MPTQEGIHTNHISFSIFHIHSATFDDLISIYQSQNKTERIAMDATTIQTYAKHFKILLSFAFSKKFISFCILKGTI